MTDRISLPYYLIEDAFAARWDSSLRFFVSLKAKYTNGTIYNATYRNISDKTQYSISQCNKHIKILINKELIRRHGKNITCISTKKLLNISREEYNNRVCKIQVTERKKQKLYISFELIKNNLDRQEYRLKQRIDLRNLQNKASTEAYMCYEEVKRMKRLTKKLGVIGEKYGFGHVGLSNNGFGQIIGVSKVTGWKYKSRMKKEGLVQTKRHFTRIRECSKWEFNMLRSHKNISSAFIYYNGYLLKENYSLVRYKQ